MPERIYTHTYVRRPGFGRWFRLLTLGAVAAAVALPAATPATAATIPAGAGRSTAATHPTRTVPSVTVHSHGRTFNAQVVKPTGIVPQRAAGSAHTSRSVPNLSTDATVYPPDTATSGLSYHGGPLELAPHVYLDFWGTQWQNDPNGVVNYLVSLFNGLGAAGDGWSASTSQYRDGSGNSPAFTGAVLAGAIYDYSGPAPAAASQSDIANEADFAASYFNASGTNVDIVVVSPSGTHPDDFPNAGWCAWHSWTGTVGYTNVPYVLDAGGSCGADSVQSALDGFSIVAGHEYAEAVTDPVPGSGYLDSNGEENGDLCAWNHLQTVALGTGTFAMQPLYSNSAGGCVYSSSGGGNPGQWTGTIVNSNGLCMDDRSSSTALFNPVQVWSCNNSGAQQWTVVQAGSTIRDFGMCLDINGGGTADGTTVDLYTCNNTGAQVWIPQSDGQLYNPQSNKCLDDTNYGGSGTQLQIWDCTANDTAQIWTLPPGAV